MLFVAFLILLFFSAVFFLFLCRMSSSLSNLLLKMSFSLAAAPVLASWLLIYTMWILPKHSPIFYLVIVLLIFLLIFLLCYKQCRCFSSLKRELFEAFNCLTTNKNIKFVIFIGILLVLALFCYRLVQLPITNNDTLNYVSLMKRLVLYGTPNFYPIISANSAYGFIAPFTHPLGYPGLLYLVKAVLLSNWPNVCRLVGAYYFIINGLLIFAFLGKTRPLAALLSVFILFVTPLFFIQSVACSIDVFRLALIQVAILNIVCIREEINNYKYLIASGVLLGLNMFTHSINILGAFMFIGAYIALVKSLSKKNMRAILIPLCIAFLFVIVRLIINTHQFGAPIADKNPVWALKSLQFDHLENIARNISSPSARWIHGFFLPLTRFNEFFFSYWLPILGGIFLLLTNRQALAVKKLKQTFAYLFYGKIHEKDYSWFLPLLAALIFYAMVFVSVALGMNSAIKNGRYLMTILPFVAIIGGIVCEKIIYRFPIFQYIVTFIMLFLLLPLLILVRTDFNNFHYLGSWSSVKWATPLDRTMSFRLGVYKTMYGIEQEISDKDRILVFQESDIDAYIKQSFISSMDPKLLPVYKASSELVAYHLLQKLQIKYIYIPYYLLPTFTQSWIGQIANNPRYSSVLIQNNMTRVYRLKTVPKAVAEHLLVHVDMRKQQTKPIWYSAAGGEPDFTFINGHNVLISWVSFGFKSSAKNIVLGNMTEIYDNTDQSLYNKYGEYRIQAKFSGNGTVLIALLGYNKRGMSTLNTPVWSGPVSKSSLSFGTLFKVPKDVLHLRIALGFKNGAVGLDSLSLFGLGRVQAVNHTEGDSIIHCQLVDRNIVYNVLLGLQANKHCFDFQQQHGVTYYKQFMPISANLFIDNYKLIFSKPGQMYRYQFQAKGVGKLDVTTKKAYLTSKKFIINKEINLTNYYKTYTGIVSANNRLILHFVDHQLRQPYVKFKNVKIEKIKENTKN